MKTVQQPMLLAASHDGDGEQVFYVLNSGEKRIPS